MATASFYSRVGGGGGKGKTFFKGQDPEKVIIISFDHFVQENNCFLSFIQIGGSGTGTHGKTIFFEWGANKLPHAPIVLPLLFASGDGHARGQPS